MSVTPQSFRGSIAAFLNPEKYPDSEINFWLTMATKLLDGSRWGNLLDEGLILFTAHNLTLEFNAKAASKVGRNPGEVQGAVTSGSVDKVSWSRDVSSALDPKNGHWNLSIYGIRYIRLAKMMGAGPVYVGAPSASEQNAGGQAWLGVITPNF